MERQASITSVKGKYLPLSVWGSKGFDTQDIEAKCEWKTSAVFGKVYKVPILSEDFECIREKLNPAMTQLLSAEDFIGKMGRIA